MKILKHSLRVIGFFIGVFILLLVIVAAITQTELFKNRLRIILTSNFATSTHAQLYLGTIHGNFLTGIVIDSVTISDENGKIISTKKITLEHDPFAIFKKTILVNHLTIEEPYIYFKRPNNSDWNINNLFTPSKDTTQSGFKWLIILNDINLKNGRITLVDSSTLSENEHRIIPATLEYHEFTLNDVNLHLSAAFQDDDLSAIISSATCHLLSPDFKLIRFIGEFKANTNGINAHNVVIQTEKSSLQFDASMKGPNIFKKLDLAKFQYDPTNVRLNASKIDFEEFKTLLPAVHMLNGSSSVDLDANGEFGNLHVKRLEVQTGSSSLKIFGYVKNLHQPSDLFLDVVIGDSKITSSDASKLLPNASIPPFKEIGQFNMFGKYAGKPADFNSTISLKGNFGDLDLSGHMNLEGRFPKYDYTFTTRSLDAGAIAGDASLKSSLFTHGEIQGEGFSPKDIIGHLDVTVDSGKIKNFSLANSNVNIKAWTHRIDCKATINSRGMNADINSSLNIASIDTPRWKGDFSVSSLDFAKLFPDIKYHTNLEFEGTINGEGKSVDDINTEIVCSLNSSVINRKEIPAQEIRFNLDQKDAGNKHMALTSELCDVNLDGKFDLDLLTKVLAEHISNLAQKIVRHTSGYDTILYSNKSIAKLVEGHTEEQRKQDMTYSVTLKKFEPIAAILTDMPLNAKGKVSGTIRGTDEDLSLSLNGLIDEFYYGSSGQGMILQNATIDLEASNIHADQSLEQLTAKTSIAIPQGQLNKLPLNNMNLTLDYTNAAGNFFVRGTLDSLYELSTKGIFSFQPQTYVFDLDSLKVAIGEYIWSNDDDIQIRLNKLGMRVLHASMKHKNESFSFAGSWDSLEHYNVDLSLRNVELGELNNWGGNNQQQKPFIFTGRTTADIHLTGTPDLPVFTMNASAESLSYRETPIGNAVAFITYENKLAFLHVNARSAQGDTLPHFYIKGELPVDLAFTDVIERFPDENQNLQIISDKFNINVFESLFPEFENLRGQIMCNITLTGSPRTPEYVGSISIQDAKLTLSSNNIEYVVSGDIEPSGERLVLKNFVIKNTPEDRPDGEARVEGSVVMKNFELDSLDLLVHGQLLVMNDATRARIKKMFGTEFIEIDDAGLKISQTFQKPKISGRVFIRDQNITFPPTKESSLNYSSLSLTYVVVDDTSTSIQSNETPVNDFFATLEKTETTATKGNAEVSLSLLKRMTYDLVIETRGPTRIKMIFTPATSEELYTELDGNVSLVGTGTPNVYGEISINSRSYYNFLKRFVATGNLKFIGPWDNPQLNITANYEGIHAKSDTLNEKVNVQLDITGTRNKPQLTMGMKIQQPQSQDYVDWSTQSKGTDVQSDAISFIMTGKFRDELTSRDKESILTSQSTSSSVLSGFTTSFLSGMLTEFLHKEFPFIRSAEVSYRGGGLQESADLRLSGEAFKGFWKFGGTILNDINNANVNYQLSLGDVLNTTSIRNLFIELEHKAEGSELGENRRLSNAARLYYRLSF